MVFQWGQSGNRKWNPNYQLSTAETNAKSHSLFYKKVQEDLAQKRTKRDAINQARERLHDPYRQLHDDDER